MWHDDEWNYSVSDMIAVLTDSNDELALEKTKVKRAATRRHQLADYTVYLTVLVYKGGI